MVKGSLTPDRGTTAEPRLLRVHGACGQIEILADLAGSLAATHRVVS
jgi:hypothetical protein